MSSRYLKNTNRFTAIYTFFLKLRLTTFLDTSCHTFNKYSTKKTKTKKPQKNPNLKSIEFNITPFRRLLLSQCLICLALSIILSFIFIHALSLCLSRCYPFGDVYFSWTETVGFLRAALWALSTREKALYDLSLLIIILTWQRTVTNREFQRNCKMAIVVEAVSQRSRCVKNERIPLQN